MNTIIRTIYAAAVVLAAVSCQKSIEPVQPDEEGKGTIDICVNGLMGEYTQVDGTKAELVNTVRVSWKGGETVYVFDGVKRLGSLKASLEGDEDRYALLSTDTAHTVKAPATGTTKLTLVYSPLLTETPTVNAGEISVSLASQNGEKAPFVAYATLDYTGTNITNAVVPFQFATSVIKVNCTGLKPGTAITSATLSNVNTACKLTLSGDKAPVVAGGTNGIITRTGDTYFADGKVNSEGEAVFQIAVPELETASGARVLTVAQGSDKVEDKKFTKKALSAATSVNTVCQLVNVLPAGALPGVFTVADDGGKTIKQIYFSQGNLWYGKVGDAQTATFNFEANQYDFQSSWSTSHVSHFFWSNTESVAYAASYSGAGAATDDVFFTNETVTTAKAGFTVNVNGKNQSGWRTLSTKEWQYLFNTRTFNNGANIGEGNSYQRATINSDATSVYGMILYPDNYTSQTDATSYTSTEWTTMEENGCVFLPAAGGRDGSNVTNVGVFGYYWSSTAFDVDFDFAYRVSFNSNKVAPGGSVYRNFCCSVRLVTDASVTPAPTPTTTGTAKATIGGSQVDVNWIQLWADGPKFAEYNVGVTDGKAESYGGYYCWGKTIDQDSDGSYKDGESPLSGDDDTATKLWGSNWRMPTQAELVALRTNCDVAWTTVNDKNGCKFTGKGAYASNSVFLPAAGYYNGGSAYYQGSRGYYWSSTPDGSDDAFSLNFDSGRQGVGSNDRRKGYSVRAVLAE